MVRMNACEYNQQTCIQLSPFFHQVNKNSRLRKTEPCKFLSFSKVGGHSSIFQYDNDTVCKVLELSELEFYQSIPDSLKSFAPEFRGNP